MSRALAALICIRLDARRGQWVSVEELALQAGLSSSQIRSACELLRGEGLLLARRAAGAHHIDAVCTPDMSQDVTPDESFAGAMP